MLYPDEIMRIAQEIPGWMPPEELDWLYQTAGRLPEGGTWVEVGVFAGRSLFAVAMGLPEGATLIAVDFQLGTVGDGWLFKTHQEILKHRSDLRLWLCRDWSHDAAKRFGDRTADAVFIDGDHTVEGARQDILDWQRVLKPGGLLCGHDYNPTLHPEVIEAVKEFQGFPVHHTIWALPGSDWTLPQL